MTPPEKPNAVLHMQRMPDIWDDTPFHTTRNTVLGALAANAVRQSPYVAPDNLGQAIQQFDRAFVAGDVFETNCRELRAAVAAAITHCPQIVAWNNPKKGNAQIAVYSRYDRPNPDYDFIDLDALARNVAHDVTVQEKFTKAQDEQTP